MIWFVTFVLASVGALLFVLRKPGDRSLGFRAEEDDAGGIREDPQAASQC